MQSPRNEIDEDPTNRWIGMITTDPEHWKEYGITTPAQYDRYMLEMDVYDITSLHMVLSFVTMTLTT